MVLGRCCSSQTRGRCAICGGEIPLGQALQCPECLLQPVCWNRRCWQTHAQHHEEDYCSTTGFDECCSDETDGPGSADSDAPGLELDACVEVDMAVHGGGGAVSELDVHTGRDLNSDQGASAHSPECCSAARPVSLVAYIDCPRHCWFLLALVSQAIPNAVDVSSHSLTDERNDE